MFTLLNISLRSNFKVGMKYFLIVNNYKQMLCNGTVKVGRQYFLRDQEIWLLKNLCQERFSTDLIRYQL